MEAAAVVGREADDVEVEQLAHHAGELEERLALAVVGVGIAAVSGEELAAAVDLVADGGNIVVIAARAEEADVLFAGGIHSEDGVHVLAQLLLGGEGRGNVKRLFHADFVGNEGIDLLHALGPDEIQHLFADSFIAVRNVRILHICVPPVVVLLVAQ